MEKQEVEKIAVGVLFNIASWILGVLFAFIGFIFIFSELIPGIAMLVVATILLPPINKIMEKKWNFHLSVWNKVLIVIIGILFFISTDEMSSTVDNQGQVIAKKESGKIQYTKVTADDLCSEYESNEIAADKKFKDKNLELTGIITSIDSDFSDDAVVHLKCGGEHSFESVSCSFLSTDEAATLKKGSKITLLGKSTGEVMGSPMVKNCKVK